MSEQVQSFNPLLILIWVFELIILGIDYSTDHRVTWSIPIIGSFLVVQIYMIWKTNYDKMMQEEREKQAKILGGDLVKNTPIIEPGRTNLQNVNTVNKTDSPIISLNLAPSINLNEKKTIEKEEKEN